MTETQTALPPGPLAPDELRRLHAWWRAANYLSVGQIYLLDNPLLREPLRIEHVKPRLLGHWGTTPGLNFVYAHLNRVIRANDLDAIFVTGPGHGGPGLVASTFLEGTYTEVYPSITRDEEGLRRLFRQFSFPGGIPSHVAPETPGSIHEGGELGYALVHAYGAAFDNPDLLVCCVVGDGEAETGPLAASWHSNKFVDPARDGAVLPVLHLNGYKIANPTVLARIPHDELRALLVGYGHEPYFVEGDDPATMHQLMAETLDQVVSDIRRHPGARARRRHRAAALADDRPAHAQGLDRAQGGRRPADGGHLPRPPGPAGEARREPRASRRARGVDALVPPGRALRRRRAGRRRDHEPGPRGRATHGRQPARQRRAAAARPDAARLPRLRGRRVDAPGTTSSEATRVLGGWLRDVMRANAGEANFRVFGPDETASNRLDALFEATDRAWMAERRDGDDHLAPDGRVMEVLSEHLCQGWLEGYLLTGRHGVFNCYEAFIHIIDSMFNQHAKWLKVTRGDPVAAADRVAELPAVLARLAPGPQRLLPPGPGLHRPRGQQEGRDHPRLPAARRQHAAVGHGPLPAQPRLRQRRGGRQAALAELAGDGRRDPALHARDRHVGLGEHRRRRRARRRARLRRRRPDGRGARRRRAAARAPARPEGARRQRRGPHAPAERRRASRTASPTTSSTRSSRPTAR